MRVAWGDGMRIAEACVSIFLIIGGSGRCAGQAGAQPAAEAFPMLKGTYWIYRGSVSEGYANGDGELQWHTSKLDLKMEVVDSVQQGRYKVAQLLGHPSELVGSVKGVKRRCHFLIAVDDKEFYLDGCSAAEESRSRLVLTDREIREKIQEENLIFRLPLEKGDSFGGTPDFPSYQWHVNEVRPLKEGAIRGISSAAPRMEYDLEFVTSHAREMATYVPGIGLIAYGFSNGGSDSQYGGVDLVEFKSPKQK